MTLNRTNPPTVADERIALGGCLDFLRATVVLKVAGLDDLAASSQPVRSVMSPLGTADDPDADFRVEPGETVDTVIARYQEACERSRQILARHDLDDRFDDGRGELMDARWVVIHLIQETARHAGHLDMLREQLDGSTGE